MPPTQRPHPPQYARTEERAGILERYPDYAVEVTPAPGRFLAEVGDVRIAATERALEVHESFHETVIYFPAEDVVAGFLVPTDHHTRCPFKGDASYFTIELDEGHLENAVWTYADPMPEVAELHGYLAFYPDRVRIVREG
jgi:uncharacterized protein (DUF427 family)